MIYNFFPLPLSLPPFLPSFSFLLFVLVQQTWSGRTQQMLVPTWQQVTPLAPATTTLTSEGVAGSQRLGDWG